MSDVIAVLNAGSSSIKFSLFRSREDHLEAGLRGQIEGIYSTPHFIAKSPEGTAISEESWPEGTELGHDAALDYLIKFLRSKLTGERLIGVGHRVVHGGPTYTQPVLVDRAAVSSLEKLVPLAPLHQPHNLAPIR